MKWFYITAYLSIWILLFSGLLPDFVIYGWLLPVMIIILLPFLLFLILKEFKVEYRTRFGVAVSSVFLGLIYGWYGQIKEAKEFEQNGKKTIGIIVEKWYAEKRYHGEYLVRAAYFVDKKSYVTFTKTDKLNKTKKGDTVTIIYLKRNPEISEIEQLK